MKPVRIRWLLVLVAATVLSSQQVLAQAATAPTEDSSDATPWRVKVDFSRTLKPMDPAYASANVNRPGLMIQDKAFDQVVKSLGFRMMRFQGPCGIRMITSLLRC